MRDHLGDFCRIAVMRPFFFWDFPPFFWGGEEKLGGGGGRNGGWMREGKGEEEIYISYI